MTVVDRKHESGFTFDALLLRSVVFRDNPDAIKKGGPIEGVGVSLDFKAEVDEPSHTGHAYLDLRVLPPESTPDAFGEFSIGMVGKFSAAGETTVGLREFMESNAAAVLFPFVREIVASISSRTRLGEVLLPPINVAALIEDAKRPEAAAVREQSGR